MDLRVVASAGDEVVGLWRQRGVNPRGERFDGEVLGLCRFLKRTDAPRITPSMTSALETLRLDRLDVIHAGRDSFPLAKHVRAIAAADLLDSLEPLRK